jgi:transposase-like protein
MADGHLGIWGAVEQIWPDAKQQRCWNHKIINVLDRLPKRLQAEARVLLTAIPYAMSRQEALKVSPGLRYPVRQRLCRRRGHSERDWDRMVTFYDFPHQHWKHLRTTNPVENPFASVRLRTNAGKRYKRVASATALIWRLMMVAEQRFRRLDASELLPLVHAGHKYEDGQLIKPKQKTTTKRKLAA